ncbi:MAG: hypothetical protein AAGA65_20710, partial [Actinomycetota bacterium]
MAGEYCEVVSAETADLFAFAESGQQYVNSLQSIFDFVSSTRARVHAAMGTAEAPAASAAIHGGGDDPMAELIAEATITNTFVAQIAAALVAYSIGDRGGVVPAHLIDAALAGVGLDVTGEDLSLEDDQTLLLVSAARRDLQKVVHDAEAGAPDHLKQNLVGQALREWLDSMDTSDPDQGNVAALALLGEGIELQAKLDGDRSVDGIDGALAALLVTQGLLLHPGDTDDLVEDLSRRPVTTPDGDRSALQLTIDALDLDQSNDYLNNYGLALSEAERTSQPWVRTNLLLQMVDSAIADDGTINETGQALVDDVLDRYPEVIEHAEDLWHEVGPEDRYHLTADGSERAWLDESTVSVFGRALAAPNFGLTDEEYDTAVGLDALDAQLIAAGSDAQFYRLLAERFALVDQLAGGDEDVALLIDSAMARGLSASE